MNGHLFGAGDPGAALLRKQRRQDAARRNAARADRQNTGHDDADAGQEPDR